MVKNLISDYSSTAASNTDVGGVNIQGSASASKMDDGLREIMSHLADHFAQDTIASAATTDLGSKAAHYLQITGTTTITALGTVKAGTLKIVEFAGALTLTHNATSLILPTGANISTGAGDGAIFVSEGAGNWRCLLFVDVSVGASLYAANNLSDVASAATAATNLGLGTGDSPQFTAVNIGHATDTTVARSAAGVISVEGNVVPSPASQASGDILYRGASAWSRLAKGTNGQYLTLSSGVPAWADVSVPSDYQPYPTSSTYPVNDAAMLILVGTTGIANGSTTSGSNLRAMVWDGGTGSMAATGAAQTGTWKNISGATMDQYDVGRWVRTA